MTSTILLFSILMVAFNIQLAKAEGTIYIRADGNIDPPTASIQRFGDLYTFTDNINDSIVVERNNIVIDGNGFTLQGNGSGAGIDLSGRANVTVRSIQLRNFQHGTYLHSANRCNITKNNITASDLYGIYLGHSSNNSLMGNSITNNFQGIYLVNSSKNIIFGNNVTHNNSRGILLHDSSNNSVSGNTITNNGFGIALRESSEGNIISENNITNNNRGIYPDSSSHNTLSGNNIAYCWEGVHLRESTDITLSNNSLNENQYNFGITGSEFSHYLHSIDTSNLVNNDPINYLRNLKDVVITPSTYPEIGYLAVLNSTNVRIEGLTLANNVDGLLIVDTNASTIIGNYLTNNRYGICLSYSSSNNMLSNNSITDTYEGGIMLRLSSNNNTLSGSTVSNSRIGIYLYNSSYNSVSENNITNNISG